MTQTSTEGIMPVFASPSTKTWMCLNDNHGTTERHAEFTYTGSCAGIVRSIDGSQWDCPCECHQEVTA